MERWYAQSLLRDEVSRLIIVAYQSEKSELLIICLCATERGRTSTDCERGKSWDAAILITNQSSARRRYILVDTFSVLQLGEHLLCLKSCAERI